MIKCPFCHFDNEDGALFCEQCKTDLGSVDPFASISAGPVADRAESAGDTLPVAPIAEPVSASMAAEVHDVPVAEVLPIAEIAPASHGGDETPHMAVPVAEATPVAEEPEAPPTMAPSAAPAEAPADGTKTVSGGDALTV